MLHDDALEVFDQGRSDDDGPVLCELRDGRILLVQSDDPGLKVFAPLCLL